jgi:hypothetical protein
VADRLRLGGDRDVTDDHIVCLNQMLRGSIPRHFQPRRTTMEDKEILNTYRAGVFFAVSNLPKSKSHGKNKNLGKASLWAALARAYYYEPVRYLEDVCHLLQHFKAPIPP